MDWVAIECGLRRSPRMSRSERHHLKSLSLHLGDWEKADDSWFLDHSRIMEDGIRSNNFFASDIMGLQPNKPRPSFPSLQSLSLTFIVYVRNLRTIHGSQLQWASQVGALELPGTFDLLDNIADSQQIIRLDSLDLVVNAEQHTDLEEIPTSKFCKHSQVSETFNPSPHLGVGCHRKRRHGSICLNSQFSQYFALKPN
jgi:hypothetical protein